jgi:hypothetical protein
MAAPLMWVFGAGLYSLLIARNQQNLLVMGNKQEYFSFLKEHLIILLDMAEKVKIIK